MTEVGPVLRVLVVEDVERDLEAVSVAVAKLPGSVDVVPARCYDEARELIVSQYFDLVILDLVLTKGTESDPEKWGGVRILWDLVDLNIQGSRAVVVHTTYPDYDVQRFALGEHYVVDFLRKGSEEDLAGSLLSVYEKLHSFGKRTDVIFHDGLSWDALVEAATRRQTQTLSARMSRKVGLTELEGLFRQMFADCASIDIYPMELGFSGTGLVRVARTFADGSVGSDSVAKFGDVSLIQREIDGWNEIKEYLAATRATEILGQRFGLGFAVLLYRFVGASDGRALIPFTRYCADTDVESINRSMRDVFGKTCGLWYKAENRRPVENLVCHDEYMSSMGIDRVRLAESYRFRFGAASHPSSVVNYPELDRALPHVVRAIQANEIRLTTTTWKCRTHGDLHGGNLLVADEGSAVWLIDFGHTGIGHWARDFVVLESHLRFSLLANSDLHELYEAEAMMARAQTLATTFDVDVIDDAGTRKAVRVIQGLRQIANELVAPDDPVAAMREYLVALVFASAKYIEFHRLLDKKWRKRHVMLAAGAMLAELELRGPALSG